MAPQHAVHRGAREAVQANGPTETHTQPGGVFRVHGADFDCGGPRRHRDDCTLPGLRLLPVLCRRLLLHVFHRESTAAAATASGFAAAAPTLSALRVACLSTISSCHTSLDPTS